MFFVFAIISMAAYALHSVWMAPYYRRNDQLTVVTLRGVGMSLAMTPALLIPGPAGLAGIGVSCRGFWRLRRPPCWATGRAPIRCGTCRSGLRPR